MNSESLNKVVFVERIKEVEGELRWVTERVAPDIDSDFAIDEDRLDHEMSRLGHLLAYYGNLYGELKAELVRKEENLKRAYAIMAQSIRVEHKKNELKITDPGVREKVESDDRYGEQQAELQIVRMYAIMSRDLVPIN